MPRRPREDVAGAIQHVFARGNDRREIWVDDADRSTYLVLLGRVTLRCRWRCLGYCLMPNHVHLLLETPVPNLGIGMQRLQSQYAQLFNERHGRTGHVFQGRYGSVRVVSDEQLWGVVAYIAMNPVRAGLCGRPELWPWSSHAHMLAGRPAPGWLDFTRLLGHFAGLGGDPRDRYAAMIEDEVPAAATVSRR